MPRPTSPVDENAGTAKINLVRLGGSSVGVSVHFATSDGTYGAAGKYTPLSGSISFAAGATSKTITITLIDPGHNLQGDQTVDLTLSNPTAGAHLGVFPTATLTLHDTSQLVAGDLDPAFGTDGKSILPDSLATPSVIASQSDGKLVIAGTGGTTTDGTNLVRVWRTDASGQPDPGFGQQGLALIPFPNFGQVKGVAVGPDGKIVVVGTAAKPTGGSEFALLRLNADGTLDTGFGQGGLVTTSFSPGDDIPVAVFVESDDSIYVAGAVDTANDASQPFAFTHYGPDGSVDIGFGDGGAMIIPAVVSPASAVLQQPDGKWLVIGGGGYDANSGGYLPGFAVRLDSDFTLDSAFGTAGIATLTWSDFYSSAPSNPIGGILIGGGYGQAVWPPSAGCNPDGSLDTTFGSGGSVSTVFNVPVGGDFGITSSFSSLFVGPDGKIVAIGSADDVGAIGGYFTAEARYNSDGSPDTSFADGGSRWFSIGGDGNDYGAGGVALPNGDIAIAATSDNLPVLASILTRWHAGDADDHLARSGEHRLRNGSGAVQLDATAAVIVNGNPVNVPGTFTYSPAVGTVLGAGSQTLSVSFTPTDMTDYTTATASAMIYVSQATPTLTWANPASIVYGTALGATQLDATASWVVGGQTVSVAGIFSYEPAAGTVLKAGNNKTLSVTFTPTDTIDYTTATASAMINVSQATPTINWANPPRHRLRHGTEHDPARRHGVVGRRGSDGECGRDLQLRTGRRHHPHDRQRPDPVGQLYARRRDGLQEHQPHGDDQCCAGDADNHLDQSRRHHLRHAARPDTARCDGFRPGHLRVYPCGDYDSEIGSRSSAVGDVYTDRRRRLQDRHDRDDDQCPAGSPESDPDHHLARPGWDCVWHSPGRHPARCSSRVRRHGDRGHFHLHAGLRHGLERRAGTAPVCQLCARRHDGLQEHHRHGADQRGAVDADDHLGRSRRHPLWNVPRRGAARRDGLRRGRFHVFSRGRNRLERRRQPNTCGDLHAERYDGLRLRDRLHAHQRQPSAAGQSGRVSRSRPCI